MEVLVEGGEATGTRTPRLVTYLRGLYYSPVDPPGRSSRSPDFAENGILGCFREFGYCRCVKNHA